MLFSICVFMLGISYILCEFDEVKYFWIKYLSILLVITTMFIMQLLYIEESLSLTIQVSPTAVGE